MSMYEAEGLFQSQEEIDNWPLDQDGQGNATLAPGDIKYKDQDGNHVLDTKDLVYVKNSSNPDLISACASVQVTKDFSSTSCSKAPQVTNRISRNLHHEQRKLTAVPEIPPDGHLDTGQSRCLTAAHQICHG